MHYTRWQGGLQNDNERKIQRRLPGGGDTRNWERMNTPKARLGGKAYAKGCVKNIRSSLILCGSTQLCAVKSVLNMHWKDWCWSWNSNTWPPGHWLIGKDRDAGRDWRREEKGTTEDEMTGWHHRLRGHEFEQALEVGDGQGTRAFFPGITKSWTRLSSWTLCCDNIQHTAEVTEMSVCSCSLVKTAGPNESGGWWCQSERRQADFLRICGRPGEMTAKANALTSGPPHLLALQS